MVLIESMKGNNALIGGGKDGEKASGWLTTWFSQLDWSTVRYLMFGISFGVVGIYQYYKYRQNKAAKEAAARKNNIMSQ